MQDDFEVLISQQEYKILMGAKEKLMSAQQNLKTTEEKLSEVQEEMDKRVESLTQANNTIKDISLKCIRLARKIMVDEERAEQLEDHFLKRER
jgi:hypothetical protein